MAAFLDSLSMWTKIFSEQPKRTTANVKIYAKKAIDMPYYKHLNATVDDSMVIYEFRFLLKDAKEKKVNGYC